MLKEKVKNLPMLPGIYLMKSEDGSVIYVGKAKRLKNRVSSYFRQNKQHSKKVLRMIHHIADFDFVVVDTELDALLLECQLIQHYRPFYNRQMNYFNNYNYIQIAETGFTISNDPTAQTYGPFRSYKKIPAILHILEETYQMPWLSQISLLALGTQLPQLSNYSFDQKKKEIQGLFQGRNKKIVRYLITRQNHFIEQLNFEKAALIQEEIALVEHFIAHIQEQKKFLRLRETILSMPLAADETQIKHYLIQFGQVADTMILPEGMPADFSQVNKRSAVLYRKRQLSKTEIDPVQILISYQKKIKKEQLASIAL
ncbi:MULTISPECIES: GIY-YIG nuclease family protein [unclassified Enterococcus]|jgi:excinuclease ABC subunit C|uniref:GIY-YIG nuclease family protein n=1 Tax=unclassified Enterococcus TaxID=2608891 RepID=UPI003D29F23F